MKNKIFWELILTTGFKSYFSKLDKHDKWRIRFFIRNVAQFKDPVKFYNTTKCKDCPNSVLLFGISDDGIGNKGIEVQIWMRNTRKELIFLKCIKVKKP